MTVSGVVSRSSPIIRWRCSTCDIGQHDRYPSGTTAGPPAHRVGQIPRDRQFFFYVFPYNIWDQFHEFHPSGTQFLLTSDCTNLSPAFKRHLKARSFHAPGSFRVHTPPSVNCIISDYMALYKSFSIIIICNCPRQYTSQRLKTYKSELNRRIYLASKFMVWHMWIN